MKHKYYFSLIAVITIYILLTATAPIQDGVLEKYNLTVIQLRLIQMTLAVPIAAIWCFAFYGFANFKEYAYRIRKDDDGKAFNYVANGLIVLGVGMVLNSLLSTITNRITFSDPGYIPAGVIVANYVSVAVSLLAFYFIYKGGVALTNIASGVTNKWRRYIFYITYGVVGAGYAYTVLSGPNNRTPQSDDTPALYYLPDWLILVSVVIPYLISWFIGILAIMLITNYRKNVKGIIYKAALNNLSLGLGFVIFSSIFVQMLRIIPGVFQDASLAKILVIIYVLLLVIAAGYVLIAKGAKKLNKLEGI